MVDRFLVRVTFSDHHSHDDVLETRQNKHTAVLHVGQIFWSSPSRIEWNIPGMKTKSGHHKPFKPCDACLLEESCAAHHSCDMVVKRAASWPRRIMPVWRKMLPSTGRASRLAGGLQECSSRLGPPFPITTARDVIRQMSKNRNCRSPKFVLNYSHTNTRTHTQKMRGELFMQLLSLVCMLEINYFIYFYLKKKKVTE